MLWLPHGALATFRMVSYGAGGTQVAAAASSGSAESESGDEGAGAGDSAGGEEAGDSGRGGGATGGGVPQPRGFTVGLMWALPGQGGNQVGARLHDTHPVVDVMIFCVQLGCRACSCVVDLRGRKDHVCVVWAGIRGWFRGVRRLRTALDVCKCGYAW